MDGQSYSSVIDARNQNRIKEERPPALMVPSPGDVDLARSTASDEEFGVFEEEDDGFNKQQKHFRDDDDEEEADNDDEESQRKKRAKGSTKSWTIDEDKILIENQCKIGNKWLRISQMLPGRSKTDCHVRFVSIQRAARREWTSKEDNMLSDLIAKYGNNFNEVKRFFPGRTINAIKTRARDINKMKKGKNMIEPPPTGSPRQAFFGDESYLLRYFPFISQPSFPFHHMMQHIGDHQSNVSSPNPDTNQNYMMISTNINGINSQPTGQVDDTINKSTFVSPQAYPYNGNHHHFMQSSSSLEILHTKPNVLPIYKQIIIPDFASLPCNQYQTLNNNRLADEYIAQPTSIGQNNTFQNNMMMMVHQTNGPKLFNSILTPRSINNNQEALFPDLFDDEGVGNNNNNNNNNNFLHMDEQEIVRMLLN